MKKILLLFLILLIPTNVLALEINSKSGIAYNRNTKEILFEKDKDKELLVASLTKIMTCILALENVNDLSEKIAITKDDINNLDGYQVIGLKENDLITYNELLYTNIMYSAADSAQTIANHVFNSNEIFINKMNELAKKIGMNNTNFSNSIGKDDNNYSSSQDISKLLDYALNNENFYKIYTTKKYYVSSLDKNISNNINNYIKNKMLKNDNIYLDGYKGGYTKKSGLSASSISKIDDNEIIVVTIGAEDRIDTMHIEDSLNILMNIKKEYSNRVILENNVLIDNIKYNNKDYQIKSNKTIKYFMKNDLDLKYLKVFYDGKRELDKNVLENDVIGNIKIYYKDKLLHTEEVKFTKNTIKKEKRTYTNLIIFISICLIGLIVFRKK